MKPSPKQLLKQLLVLIETTRSNLSREKFSEILHEDVRWTFPVGAGPVVGGVHEGLDAAVNLLSAIFSDIYNPDCFQYEFHSFFGDNQYAAARYRVNAESATGEPYENDYALLAHIQNGKISELWEFVDTLAALKQLHPSINLVKG